jgi:hypothetical protein
MSWRLANSLITLRSQINAAYPNRNKASDGTIGDAAHAASISDHNPNSAGVVTAFDITHDPAHGLDIWPLANALSPDPRVKYLIANRKVYIDGRWQNYTGVDPHTNHVHVSVSSNNYDNAALWQIGENDMAATKEQLIELYKLAFPNQDVNYQWVNAYTGKDMSDVIQALRDDASRQRYITAIVNDAAAYNAGAKPTDLKPGLYRVK